MRLLARISPQLMSPRRCAARFSLKQGSPSSSRDALRGWSWLNHQRFGATCHCRGNWDRSPANFVAHPTKGVPHRLTRFHPVAALAPYAVVAREASAEPSAEWRPHSILAQLDFPPQKTPARNAPTCASRIVHSTPGPMHADGVSSKPSSHAPVCAGPAYFQSRLSGPAPEDRHRHRRSLHFDGVMSGLTSFKHVGNFPPAKRQNPFPVRNRTGDHVDSRRPFEIPVPQSPKRWRNPTTREGPSILRSGETDEWKEHLASEHEKHFNDLAGELLMRLGFK